MNTGKKPLSPSGAHAGSAQSPLSPRPAGPGRWTRTACLFLLSTARKVQLTLRVWSTDLALVLAPDPSCLAMSCRKFRTFLPLLFLTASASAGIFTQRPWAGLAMPRETLRTAPRCKTRADLLPNMASSWRI